MLLSWYISFLHITCWLYDFADGKTTEISNAREKCKSPLMMRAGNDNKQTENKPSFLCAILVGFHRALSQRLCISSLHLKDGFRGKGRSYSN